MFLLIPDLVHSRVYFIYKKIMDERILEYFEKELNSAGRLALLRQIESDEELRKQFIEYKNMNSLLSLSGIVNSEIADRQGLNLFRSRLKTKKLQMLVVRVVGYAAIIALLVGGTWWNAAHYFSKQLSASTVNTLYVPAGQRIKLTLQDGTGVWLNSRTTITYPITFSEKERRVSIEGEAFFEVTKNPRKPFIVTSQGVDMKVLGTKFNVDSYSNEHELKTSLIEGSLQVLSSDKMKSVILKPNEQVTVKGSLMSVTAITHKDQFLWIKGIYSFTDEPLGNILKKLELYYDTKIVVEDPSISSWVYTGKFRQSDGLNEILRMIQQIHKFKIRKNEKTNEIRLSI